MRHAGVTRFLSIQLRLLWCGIVHCGPLYEVQKTRISRLHDSEKTLDIMLQIWQ